MRTRDNETGGTKKKELERDIMRQIGDWLTEHNYFFWRSNNFTIFGQSKDGKMRFRAMPKYSRKGVPDIIVIDRGQFIGLEVKRPGAKLRPDQVKFGEEIILNGGRYYCVHSVEEVSNYLNRS